MPCKAIWREIVKHSVTDTFWSLWIYSGSYKIVSYKKNLVITSKDNGYVGCEEGGDGKFPSTRVSYLEFWYRVWNTTKPRVAFLCGPREPDYNQFPQCSLLAVMGNLKNKTSAFRWAEQNFEALRWQCTIDNAIVKNKMKRRTNFKYESI